jgi:hypothetical protein
MSHLPTASFPTAIWDGTTPHRAKPYDDVAPNAADLQRVISEVVAIETKLGTGSEGSADSRLDNLEATVDTASTGLTDRVEALETTVDTASTGLTDRVEAVEGTLDTATTGIVDRVEALETTIDTDDTGLVDIIDDQQDQLNALDTDLAKIMDRAAGLILQATGVEEDLRFPVSAVKVHSDKPPTWVAYKAGEVLSFSDELVANEQSISFVAQFPHRRKLGEAIDVHIHWVGADNTAGNVYWEFSYSWASMEEVFPAATTVNKATPNSTTTDNHNYDDICDINSNNLITLGSAPANSDVYVQAKHAGYSIKLIDPAANDASIQINLNGGDIEVSLATGPGGAITTTAAELKTALDAVATSYILTTVEGDGSGVVSAKSKTTLTQKGHSSIMLCTLKRKSSDALDTFDAKAALLLEIDIHYQVDKLGATI